MAAGSRAPRSVPQSAWERIRAQIRAQAQELRREHACRRLWADAESFEELCALMVRFVRGELESWPGHGGPRCPETIEIADALAHANARGFLTHGSQPGVDDFWAEGDASTPRLRQRPTVEGHASDEVLARLREVCAGTRLRVTVQSTYRFGARARYDEAFVATVLGEGDQQRACTHFGARMSRRELVFMWEGIEERLIKQILPLHQVNLADPRWGPHRLLWERLMKL